jgi:hypothetical protein
MVASKKTGWLIGSVSWYVIIYQWDRLILAATVSAVVVVNVGGAVMPVKCPGALAVKLSLRARHHGAIFASPGERYACLGCRICPVLENSNLSNEWKIDRHDRIVMVWSKMIATSLLPQPSVLAFRGNFKLSRWKTFVTIIEICQGFKVPANLQDLYWRRYFINSSDAF